MVYLKIWMVRKMIKDKSKKNKNDEIFRRYSLNQAGMLIQFILVIALILFIILTIFHPALKVVSQIILFLTLLIMAYNNYHIYKRKTFTIIYLVVALFILISILWIG